MPRNLPRPVRRIPLSSTDEPLWDEAAWAGRLTVKELMFVREYLVDLNATGAARRAHYRWPNSTAFKLMDKPHVREAVQEALDERARRLGVAADEVLAEIAGLAFSSMADVIEWGEREGPDGRMERDVWLKPREAAPEAVWRGVQEIRFAGGAIHVRCADKLTALALLAKHLGMMPVGRPGTKPKARAFEDMEPEEKEAVTKAVLAESLDGLTREQRDRIRAIINEHAEERQAARAAAKAEN